MKQTLFAFFLILLLSGCGAQKEYVMPFVNYVYSGERLFPVSKNDDDFTFRVWANFSTTTDRVFTVSHSETLGYFGDILEINRGQSRKRKKDKKSFKETQIIPNSGLEKFIAKVDSLNLLNIADQDEKNFGIPVDRPISLFIIEIKSHGKINQFKFRTYYPDKGKVEEKYQQVQDLILKELPFKFHTQ